MWSPKFFRASSKKGVVTEDSEEKKRKQTHPGALLPARVVMSGHQREIITWEEAQIIDEKDDRTNEELDALVRFLRRNELPKRTTKRKKPKETINVPKFF